MSGFCELNYKNIKTIPVKILKNRLEDVVGRHIVLAALWTIHMIETLTVFKPKLFYYFSVLKLTEVMQCVVSLLVILTV